MNEKILSLIQGVIDTVKAEQDLREEMQHEINVLRRQIAELRLVVFKSETLVSMPRLEAAMHEMAKENQL